MTSIAHMMFMLNGRYVALQMKENTLFFYSNFLKVIIVYMIILTLIDVLLNLHTSIADNL